MVPSDFHEAYWDWFVREAEWERQFLFSMFREGWTEEDMLKAYTERFWGLGRGVEQPKEAFLLNAAMIIRVFREEYALSESDTSASGAE